MSPVNARSDWLNREIERRVKVVRTFPNTDALTNLLSN
ncbi:MAG: transposase [Lentisphaeria bacterium]|nr:transposase [Candidatus Neomarinimicrobiota bacterium]MCF7843026.1 transposase [Lentisphaeria bacterium]